MRLQRKLRVYARQDEHARQWINANRAWIEANHASLYSIFSDPQKEAYFLRSLRSKNPKQQLQRLAQTSTSAKERPIRRVSRASRHEPTRRGRRKANPSKQQAPNKPETRKKASLFSSLPLSKIDLPKIINTVQHVNKILTTMNELRSSVPANFLHSLLEETNKRE